MRVVEREPVAPGVNVTVNVQEFPAVRDVHDPAQEFVTVKSPAFPPVTVGVIPVAVIASLFVTVNTCGELDEPEFTEPKLLLAGDSVVLAPTSGTMIPYQLSLLPAPPPQPLGAGTDHVDVALNVPIAVTAMPISMAPGCGVF